ncbi:uncharacterized protein [Dermacentor albipictus]|uniref:uncharacterized protein n=1 Tax=Dermacentor albipictus TaxID=60249 RepID=UPI0038FCE395
MSAAITVYLASSPVGFVGEQKADIRWGLASINHILAEAAQTGGSLIPPIPMPTHRQLAGRAVAIFCDRTIAARCCELQGQPSSEEAVSWTNGGAWMARRETHATTMVFDGPSRPLWWQNHPVKILIGFAAWENLIDVAHAQVLAILATKVGGTSSPDRSTEDPFHCEATEAFLHASEPCLTEALSFPAAKSTDASTPARFKSSWNGWRHFSGNGSTAAANMLQTHFRFIRSILRELNPAPQARRCRVEYHVTP